MTYSWKKGMSIDQQWESWQEHNPLDKIEAPDTETLKEAVIKDLSYVSAMDVKEYTLYQKWCEVHDKSTAARPSPRSVNCVIFLSAIFISY